ncbi:hypothetical protein [Crateriforma spongiae]|uniref:hypothetical protein n=1 Tax=Crateriforma spongiae TaxID=2724528 RepID=UPI001F31F5D4|nr:hypothetical protein [Crateriforma spongiae]
MTTGSENDTDPSGPTCGPELPALIPDQCQLCRRITRKGTTRHHLIPRRCHRNKWFKKRFTREQMQQTIPLCRDCHSAIHRFVPSEKELGRNYGTVQALLSHDRIRDFVAWVRHRR